MTTFNRRFVDLWRITEDFSDLERVRAEMAVQITDPEGWRQRLEEIDATRPADSSDVIELCDGRVYERFSKLQMIGDRVSAGCGASATSPSGGGPSSGCRASSPSAWRPRRRCG